MNRNSWTVDGVGEVTPLSYVSWPVNAVSHTQFYQFNFTAILLDMRVVAPSRVESCQFQVAAKF